MNKETGYHEILTCPYGKPGDILWVRETWCVGAWDENTGSICVDYKADGCARRDWIRIENNARFEKYWIESTDDASTAGLSFDGDGQYHWEPGQGPTRWRPSIFMPREAARIFLRVTNVRVERLQEITEDEARAEGINWLDDACYENNRWSPTFNDPDSGGSPVFRDGFKALWDSLNLKRGYGWDTNCWVWVIEFAKL
jgi:hypothetical protein